MFTWFSKCLLLWIKQKAYFKDGWFSVGTLFMLKQLFFSNFFCTLLLDVSKPSCFPLDCEQSGDDSSSLVVSTVFFLEAVWWVYKQKVSITQMLNIIKSYTTNRDGSGRQTTTCQNTLYFMRIDLILPNHTIIIIWKDKLIVTSKTQVVHMRIRRHWQNKNPVHLLFWVIHPHN